VDNYFIHISFIFHLFVSTKLRGEAIFRIPVLPTRIIHKGHDNSD